MSKAVVIFRKMFFRATVLVACLAFVGCVAHRSVESTYEKIATELEPGDRVEVELESGRELSFRVTEIRETELVGDTSTDITRGEVVTIQYSDIKRLERVDQRPLVVIGAVASPLIVLLIAFLLFGGVMTM